jgi:hypothetical protein
MSQSLGQHRRGRLAAVVLTLTLAGGPTRADDGDKQVIEELRRRMEQLEKHNQRLLQMLERLHPAEAGADEPTPRPRPEEPAAVPQPGEEKIKGIIADYLKDREEEQKREVERKKVEAECQGWEIGKLMNMKARFDGAYGYSAFAAATSGRSAAGGPGKSAPATPGSTSTTTRSRPASPRT